MDLKKEEPVRMYGLYVGYVKYVGLDHYLCLGPRDVFCALTPRARQDPQRWPQMTSGSPGWKGKWESL